MSSVDEILKGKYPAKAHARRVVEYIRKTKPDATGVLYLESAKTKMLEDNDSEAPFRQRRYFYYLSGCPLADSSLSYDIEADKLTLYIPPIDADSVIWSGLPLSKDEALTQFDIDDVSTTDEINAAFTYASSRKTAWAIANQVSENVSFLSFDNSDFELLKEAIEECRVVKDEYEIALTKKANEVTAIAHKAVLAAVKHKKNERELEAIFLERSIANGCREQSYHSIVASGTAAATLHYVDNAKPLSGKLNLLLDAGAEYSCYTSDVTRTFPISGKFSTESRAIYDIVLQMQKVTIGMLKEGVDWDEVHLTAHKIAIEGLLNIGILRGNKEDILEARTSVAFFPHGLGHYLGMDTHDVGGHPKYDDKDPMFRYLRVRRKLPAGSIITVEPGIYFCRFIIEPYLADAKQAQFIDKDVLEKYWEVGGVRIEDNLLITKDGYENLTYAPKEVDEMEAIINGA